MRRRTRHRELIGAGLLAAAALACDSGTDRPETPTELPIEQVVFHGHAEVELVETASGDPDLRPIVSSSAESVGYCLRSARAADTSTWRATLTIDDGSADLDLSAHTRVRNTLCFQTALPTEPSTDLHRLCGTVVDSYDGRSAELPCRTFERRDLDDSALREELTRIFRAAGSASIDETRGALETLSRRAATAGFPFYSVRTLLVATHFLRQEGSESALQSADDLLAGLPAWLELPEAAAWRAQVRHQRAGVHLAGGRFRSGWRELFEAEENYRLVADPIWLTVAQQRAIWTARLGAPKEAAQRLRSDLAECEVAPCQESVAASARRTLGWLVLNDPDAGPAALEEAGELLDEDVRVAAKTDQPADLANRWINVALHRTLTGRSPESELATAREYLAETESSWSRELDAWAAIVEAEHALRSGDPTSALEFASKARAGDPPALVATRALDLAARSHLALGDPEAAEDTLSVARVLYDNLAIDEPSVDLGPSHRAEVFYRAARAAVERGEFAEAWDRLEHLDTLSTRALCGVTSDPSRAAERERLLAELATLELPAARAWRENRQSIRTGVRRRLQTLARELSASRATGCDVARPTPDTGLDLKIFSVDDEVFFLQRAGGGIRLLKRAALPKSLLTETLDDLRETDGEASVAAWRDRYAPIVEALTPPLDRLGEVTRVALYGLLQDVPLAALPVGDFEAGDPGSGWLGTHTTIVVRPAGALGTAGAPDFRSGTGLFVVDPQRNLAGARATAPLYRDLFPDARVLVGDEATLSETTQQLERSPWLHLDAHGEYDPAFPELTRIRLADRPLDFSDLEARARPLGFANLSGCDTGRSPTGAGSGRFGLAGLLVRRGARWVIASRSELSDRAAQSFNELFYTAVAGGASVVPAYRQAMAHLRENYSPAEWAPFLLLEGPSPLGTDPAAARDGRGIGVAGGQSAISPTP